jgi:hypothetical protein
MSYGACCLALTLEVTEFFDATAWDRFSDHARYVLANPLFEREERDRRSVIAMRVRELLAGAAGGAALDTNVASLLESLSPVGRAYVLTNVGQNYWLERWVGADEQSLRRALLPFCDHRLDPATRIETFLQAADAGVVDRRPQAAITIASLLNASMESGALPFVRFQPFETLEQDLGYKPKPTGDLFGQYEEHLLFARRIYEELRTAGVAVQGIRDAEALIFISSRRGEGWLSPLLEAHEPIPQGSITIEVRQARPRSYLAICSCLGYDTSYLLEWLEFHRLVGVERFFLYNNGDRETQEKLLAPYVEDGTVVLHDWPVFPPQVPAYKHCVANHVTDARWIAFIDTDEFLFSPTRAPLPEVLKDYEEWPAVGVNWALFGPSGHRTRPPGFVIENYLVRLNIRNDRSIKSIVDPSQVSQFATVHNFHLKQGCTVDENHYPVRAYRTTYVSGARLRLNHYHTRSQEEWQVKRARPRPDTGVVRDEYWGPDLEQLLTQEAKFGTEDRAILQYLPALRSVVKNAELRANLG